MKTLNLALELNYFTVEKYAIEEIAKILQEEKFEVKIVDAKEEKIKDISEYELVVVGSSVACNRWVNEAEDFLSSDFNSLVHHGTFSYEVKFKAKVSF